MRVLYSFPHPVGKAGIGTTALNEVTSVARHGVEVTLFCTSLEREPEGTAAVVETLRVAGRRVPHRLIGVERAYRYHDRRVARALHGLRDSIDLVHAWPKASEATFRAARTLGIPCIREAPNTHTAYAFTAVEREETKLGLATIGGHSHSFDSAKLEREELEYELADLVLVPSEFARATFLEQGIPAEKLALNQYGFDESRFPPPTDGPSVAGHGLRALFVGSCEPRKGLHYALEAWVASGAAEHGRFLVCGNFVPGYREAVAHWLEHPSVEHLGFVSDPGALMRASDILIFPSIEEGSALVTYEAQASGCVLLVSDATGARFEHLRHGLLHSAGDVATLTAQIRQVNEDRDLLGRLREATLAARNELTWDRAGERLAEVYRAAVSRSQV